MFITTFLGCEQRRRFLGLNFLNNRRLRELSRTYLDTLGISIPSVNSKVDMLSGGQRQCIAVARSIYSSPTVLTLDETLGALGVRAPTRFRTFAETVLATTKAIKER